MLFLVFFNQNDTNQIISRIEVYPCELEKQSVCSRIYRYHITENRTAYRNIKKIVKQF